MSNSNFPNQSETVYKFEDPEPFIQEMAEEPDKTMRGITLLFSAADFAEVQARADLSALSIQAYMKSMIFDGLMMGSRDCAYIMIPYLARLSAYVDQIDDEELKESITEEVNSLWHCLPAIKVEGPDPQDE